MQWRIVFWVAFSIFIASAVIYTVWAEGEVQPWNEMHQEVDDKEKENSWVVVIFFICILRPSTIKYLFYDDLFT